MPRIKTTAQLILVKLLTIFLLLQWVSFSYAEKLQSKKKKETGLTTLKLVGVDGVLEKNIEARLPAFKPECDADLQKLEQYKRAIITKLNKATKALGYYHSNASFSINKANNCWNVVVKITSGAPVLVQKQDIIFLGEGRKKSIFNELPLPYKIQAPLNHLKYTEYKARLLELAQEHGYLAAKFSEKEILVDLKKNTAIITLHFDTGTQFRYGAIQIEQAVLSDKYMQRYIKLKKNKFFSSTELVEQHQLLQNSGYYSAISVHPDYENAKQGVVPISIVLTEKKRDHYRFKLGFGTDTGLRSQASLNRRWTGSAGQKLTLALGLSQKINEFTTQLVVPKDDPEKNNLFYNASIKQEDNEDVHSQSVKIGVISTRFVERDWKRGLSLSYLTDKTRVDGENVTRSNLTLLGIQYAKIRADNRIFPNKGWRVRFAAEGAINKILSDATVLQLSAHGKYVKKVGSGRLLIRTDFGATFGDNLDDLPKDLRFFSGGINNIRGYGYETLGEVNSEGKVIGGKNLIELSLEYEYPLFKQSEKWAKWQLAAFVDMGNAFDDIRTSEVKVGVGLGIRWNSPIGPVRLDFGVPEDNLGAVHFHLSIGPDL